MKTFRNYILSEFGIEMPKGEINGSWFVENGLPMVVACTCCGMTMSSPSAWIDRNGQCFCGGCIGAEDDWGPYDEADDLTLQDNPEDDFDYGEWDVAAENDCWEPDVDESNYDPYMGCDFYEVGDMW